MTARRVAVATWWVCVLLAAPSLVLITVGLSERTPADGFGLTGLGGLVLLAAAFAYVTVGAVVTTRVRSNPIGGVFCGIGFLLAACVFCYEYADWALFIAGGEPPAGSLAAVLQNLTGPPAFGLLGLALLLFPNGHLVSRKWNLAGAMAVMGSLCSAAGYAWRPGRLDFPFHGVDNPIGFGTWVLWQTVSNAGWVLMGLSVASAAVSLLVRRRHANAVERRQLAWVGLAAAFAGVVIGSTSPAFMLGPPNVGRLLLPLVGVAFVGFPIAAGIAILRYRLYEIDRIVNRAVVYLMLTAVLVAAYVGSVLLLGVLLQPLTRQSNLAVAMSTLLVAALFQPARRRIQNGVDRRFFRSRYDTQRTLEGFSVRLREEIDLRSVRDDLGAVVAETVQPAHVSLWLRPRP
jgi:hypothetical protein